jgi:hypothetical protein
VFGLTTVAVVLSGVATSKSTCTILRSKALYFGCAMFDAKKLEEFNSENYLKTLVIKVSRFSFSKL